MSLTVGSLFAGIGGFELGLERAGMKTVWQVEKDEYARKVLAKHWPDVRRHDDVCTFPPGDPDDWRCDLICGGFPCQDISGANPNALGLAGKRSGLWSEYMRILRVLRPRFVLVENVAALLDRGFGRVLGDMASLGFDAEWDVLSASAYGAPHERARVFLVAYPGGFARGRRVVFDRKHDLPRDSQWSSTQGLKSGRVWKRWLIEACAAVDGNDPDAWFCRVDDGLPSRMDENEFRVYGNAVMPVAAEWIGRRIVERENSLNQAERH